MRHPTYKRLGLPFAVLTSFLCMLALSDKLNASEHESLRHIRLGEHQLAIPERYLQGAPIVPDWLRYLPGLDNGSSHLLLTIDAAELAAAIPGYRLENNPVSQDMNLIAIALKPNEVQRYSDPMKFSDLWLGLGSYKDRVTEREPSTGFVRIYRRVEFPRSWQVFKISPAEGPMHEDLESFWVGSCLIGQNSVKNRTTCNSSVLVGNILVEFSLSQQNLHLVDAIRTYLGNSITQWKKE